MSLIDKVKIYVRAGDGGNGAVSFHREKYVSHGGPDGGDGGNGGSIIVRIAEGESTLIAYKSHRKFIARDGGDGKAGKMHGENSDDIILDVPNGTVIRDAESGLIIKDMSSCEPFVLCKGGRGGWGNRHFATPTRQIPRFAKSGIKGEEKEVIFELKMLADVGIIGLPNVGKSTLLSVISAAKPKIANYQFTTLSPNLGVVRYGENKSFVAADIPGLIEGASEGAGLGHAFLRHVDRCRLFIHVVDVSDIENNDPIKAIETINHELESYSEELAARPQIIAANKFDMVEDPDTLEEFDNYCADMGYEVFHISAATHDAVDFLLASVIRRLDRLPPMTTYETEVKETDYEDMSFDHSVEIRRENDTFYVEAEWLYNLIGSVNFEDRESLRYFQRVLKNSGVIAALEEKGCTEGHTVSMYDFEFDFIK